MNRSTVFRHFPRREDLIDALGERIRHQLDKIHREGRAEGGTAAEQLERIVRRNVLLGEPLAFFFEHWRELLHQTEGWESIQSWEDLLSAAKREGAIRRDLPLDWVGRFVTGTILAGFRAIRDGAFSAEQAAQLVTSTIRDGLSPPPQSRGGNAKRRPA